VSLVSGTAIADALERLGHKVARADISPGDLSALDRKGADVIFIALHGQFGESGEVQELCEARGLRYTGSPPRASELAMDKDASKRIFRLAGLATPDWVVLDGRREPAQAERLKAKIPLPAVLKPINGGSSVDISIVRDEQSLDKAAGELVGKYGGALVESFVKGREFTVSILGDMPLPVLEVVPAREFYDYTAKYADDSGTRYVFDHGLTDAAAAIQQAALAAHNALGCRDMSRVDFMLDSAGVPQVLEVNTIPGFTGHSLLPMAAARAGISFEGLVDRLVEMAMRR